MGGNFTWPTANKALFVPVPVALPFLVKKMFVVSNTASGNIDVGIYDAQGNRLVSAGSTLQAGTVAIQPFDVTDTLLNPGLYYFAVAHDTAAGTVLGASALNVNEVRALGVLEMATAFPLPNPATFAATSEVSFPYVAATSVTTI